MLPKPSSMTSVCSRAPALLARILDKAKRTAEAKGLLTANEKGELLPAREMARIQLREILDVVRSEGETGSYREPSWEPYVETLGDKLDEASLSAVGSMTLSELVDAAGPSPGSASTAGEQ